MSKWASPGCHAVRRCRRAGHAVRRAARTAHGRLLALLVLYCKSRQAARCDAAGRFIALADQGACLWSRDQRIEAEGWLTEASRSGQFGRFQCEAAIQSVQAQRPLARALALAPDEAIRRHLLTLPP